jgi:hypothetical protein
MILLTATTDKIQIVTDAAVTVDVHVSAVDLSGTTVTPLRQNTAISTATTTDVLAAPASSTQRNLKTLNARNRSTSASVGVLVQFNQNATIYELFAATLRPGETLEYVEGVGFFVVGPRLPTTPNASTSDQSIGASATAYLAGSALRFDANPSIGTVLQWRISVAKSGAATATETWDIRFGANGTTGDTARNSFTGDTETAVADEALVDILCTIRGPISASCVAQALWCMDDNLTTTGFSNAARKAQVRVSTSAAFDITGLPLIVGIALTTGASHAITVRQVVAQVIKA